MSVSQFLFRNFYGLITLTLRSVKRRPHQVDVVLSHCPPAYIDEPYPISVDVTNNDDRDLVFSLDVLLQPGDDDTGNYPSSFC